MDHDLDGEGFRQLFETAPDAVVIVDGDGRIVLVNQQVERLFGYARGELLGQPVESLIPKRFRAVHHMHRGGYTRSPQVRPMGTGVELFGCRKDGSEFPVEISLSPVAVTSGTFISASIRDVSDRKRLEAETQRLQQYLLSAIDSIEGSFFIWDAKDRLVVCNSTARAHWSCGFGEISGRTWAEIMDANVGAGTIALDDESLEQVQARLHNYHKQPVATLRATTGSGGFVRVMERRTPEGGTVGLITDVSDDVERENELRRARATAEAASSAKSEFLSSMSHELRTPLNAVLGFAQLLQRDKKTPLTQRQQERLQYVLRGGEHLLRLIDDVLDLARIEAGRVPISVEPVDVSEVLADVESTVRAIADGANIDLNVEPIPNELPQVNADRTRFKQILMNYASNAIKYGRKGGSVKLQTLPSHEFIRVNVIDDGLGISADKQAAVFEPFHRAGQEAGPIEGTGIGLTISKRLAELMGGRVGFHSVEGQGSEFWVELPVRRDRVEQRAVSRTSWGTGASSLSDPAGKEHRVVYIEDNPSNLAFMEDLLSEFERVKLFTASSAEIGIELVRAHLPSLVIMDINLPGMSGIEARRRLQEWSETREIPVVALSAAAMAGEAKRIQGAGFHRYLAKPVCVDDLMAVLQELLSQDTSTAVP